MLLLIWTVVFLAALTLYLRQVYSKFSKHGVKTIRPLPLVGNMFGLLTRQKHFVEDITGLYSSFPEERFVGRYELLNPMLVIRDLDLVKKITVKDFEHFLDHRGFVAEKETLFARNLFSLKGQEWKDMRSTLSPAFTSSKIKLMVPFMDEVGKQMLKVLEKKIEEAGGSMNIDVKDLTSRYANDVIASCAFGLKVDSHTEENNTFYEMGKTAATFKFKQLLMFFLQSSFPALVKRLNLSLFTEATKKFFTNIVLDTMGEREAKNIIRPDMIHLLMQAKKGQLSHEDHSTNGDTTKEAGFSVVEESSLGKKTHARVWSDDDLIAQAVLFFIAGFETISSAMSLCLHEIAMHPEVQERLAQEIKETDENNNGKIDYNSIQNMTYLDMVVSEVLRLWPPAIILDRLCVKDYNLGRPNEKTTSDYVVRKGENVSIPTWAIHRDPQYFPNPKKFDPERFSEENKHQINPFAYMPFGLGPRNCIGSRFALCELKVLIYQILLRMEIYTSEKLRLPVQLSKDGFNIRIEGGSWVRFKVRN